MSTGKKPKSNGFTLIELLVVITIIAILATLGLAIFSSLQRNARDSRRRSDINAIAKAMEANYGVISGYQSLQASWFGGGTYPVDPNCTPNPSPNAPAGPSCPSVSGCGGNTCRYCVRQTSTGIPPLTPALCTTSGTGSQIVRPNWPPGVPYWIVCTNLEGGGFYCKNSQR